MRIEARRILYVRTDRIGDTLMNLPAVRVLRQTFPKSWITMLVDENVAELFRGHPDVDEVLTVRPADLKAGFGGRFRLFRKIRSAKFDLAVISNPSKFFHLLAFLCPIRHRIGWRRKWGFLLTKSLPDRKALGAGHEIDFNLDLVALVSDKRWDGRLSLAEDPAALARVEKRLGEAGLRDKPIVAIHAGTSAVEKRWPSERFVELGRMIQARRDFSVVLVGGEEETENSRQVLKGLEPGAVDWTGLLRLSDLAAFLSRANVRILVSSDSGPVHMAWMAGTPVVALYAKNSAGSNPARWGPRDPKSEVIYKPVQEIASAEVFEAFERVLRKNGGKIL